MSANVPSDIAIAQSAKLRPILDVARDLGLKREELIPFGDYKAKVRLDALRARERKARLVVVTAINPTAAGEGKSTVTVGVTQALRRLGQNAVLCMREPSLGPVFGVKGGAAGGGCSQVVPMEDINLHFTGDFHAISSAHNLLSAMLDNHLHQGNTLGVDPRRITWPRTLDMNDRALRHIVIGLGGTLGGVPREEHFVITPASEIMAIMALARDLDDLQARLARIIVGETHGGRPVRASDLKAEGAMTLLLKDALLPNLVQTLEGGPAFVHCGPFGNIAHGCNSVVATELALRLADIVVTEAGFGADLGFEKFLDIKCRSAGLTPEAAIVVATVRALKLHGGAAKDRLREPDVAAVERGIANLARHLENIAHSGVPPVVAINRFTSDAPQELKAVADACERLGITQALSEVWAKGGEGGLELGRKLLAVLERGKPDVRPFYDVRQPIRTKIETLATRIYRADGVDFTTAAERSAKKIAEFGLGETPVCMAKTQYSFSDDPGRLGAPAEFRITIRDLIPAAGAGFVVALAGDIMTMPGLGRTPAAERMRVTADGTIEGLF
ncbi:MAG: formate--tetrahydrofolate ligase [Gemmatimonadetes bacterium]|nr:formate--tetrahydrofolate ligase [Gemmatimonadota bacterium]